VPHPAPNEAVGLVVAAPGAIDPAAIRPAITFTEADAEALRARLRERAASALETRLMLAAEADACRAAREDARDARQFAARRRAEAAHHFEVFDRGLRDVVDATGLLAAAKAEEAEARASLDAASERLTALAGHRNALEDSIRETGARIGLAEQVVLAQNTPTAAAIAALEAGAELARRAHIAAESARVGWVALATELGVRRDEAAAQAGRLRALVEGLDKELMGRDTPLEVSVRSALASYDAATWEATDRLAVSLADRWAEAHRQLAELDLVEPPPPTPGQLAAARERVSSAEASLALAAESGRSGNMSAEEREAIERAHAELGGSRKLQGRAARHRQRRAEDALHDLLAPHGLTSWVDYLTAGLAADARQKVALAEADAELMDARGALAELEAACEPSPDREAVLDAIERTRRDVTDLLGFWPEGEPERQLRAQPLVDRAASWGLFQALVQAGVPMGGQPIAAAARAWLEELTGCRTARSEVEAELAQATGQLEALALTDLGSDFSDVMGLAAETTVIAAGRSEQYARVEGLLQSTLEMLRTERADGEAPAALTERESGLRWVLGTVEHDAQEAHLFATEQAEVAAAARAGAEEALAAAWRSLRGASPGPVTDLPAAVHVLGRLLSDSAAAGGALDRAEEAFARTELAVAAAEAALRDHVAGTEDLAVEPAAEHIAAQLESGLDGEPTPIVLDEPFPNLTPASFARVLSALADLAAQRLVIFVVDQAAPFDQAEVRSSTAEDGMVPSQPVGTAT
jgi:hypothetical protein